MKKASYLAALLLAGGLLTAVASDKKIVLIAGGASHGPGDHEHRAGCLLLQQCLNKVPGVKAEVYTNGWPDDPRALDGADTIFVYSDGGGGHPFLKPERLAVLRDLMKKGVGLGTMHYAVEVPKENGGKEWLEWTGGYFETFYSVNPTWTADFKTLPEHPVARGVQPFKMRDEWYYHMRFQENMKGVTPILTTVPPDETRGKPGVNDAHGGNSEVQACKGQPEHVMWVYERPDGGRGFGCTGGHFHKEWGRDAFRTLILNAILWSAKAEVPTGGVQSTVTPEDLSRNLDPKGR